MLSAGLGVTFTLRADGHVALRGIADPEYTARKFGPDGARLETYVFLEGRYFPGITADRSISRMPFRRIAEMLARDLARENFLPAKDVKSAHLLIVVHWGTTVPNTSVGELTARTSTAYTPEQSSAIHERAMAEQFDLVAAPAEVDPATAGLDHFSQTDDLSGSMAFEALDQATAQMASDLNRTANADLLGYSSMLRRFDGTALPVELERTLRLDLATERYFIILKAFDLKAKTRKPVWSAYLNTRAPGINFRMAVDRLGHAGTSVFGRTTDGVTTVRVKEPQGTVTIEPPIVIEFED